MLSHLQLNLQSIWIRTFEELYYAQKNHSRRHTSFSGESSLNNLQIILEKFWRLSVATGLGQQKLWIQAVLVVHLSLFKLSKMDHISPELILVSGQNSQYLL